MISKLSRALVAFCVATVLTQMLLMSYFLIRGTLNRKSATKLIALVNGIDITGNRLQEIMKQTEDLEQPSFDEILAERKMKSLDMDIRLRSQQEFRDELSLMLSELKDDQDRFSNRLLAFRTELKEMGTEAQESGLQEVQRTLQSLDPEQSKEQLLIMYADKRIDDVVTILQAMSTDARKDILAEFNTPEDVEILSDILRRIGEGMPVSSLIKETDENL
ncbi:MAG: hypothetical protein OSA98_01910 [Rubripirellula sp.]|jgi:hypothetical protein|nr:hypothetical protein [Rubripirellula sp.]|tara:strand:+ start:622 stop:1278 length:657 start_codon:yes stop_codon:yes gene_type:complete